MHKQTLQSKIEHQVIDIVDAINEWDDFLVRNQKFLPSEVYNLLVSENDAAYQEAIESDSDANLVAA